MIDMVLQGVMIVLTVGYYHGIKVLHIQLLKNRSYFNVQMISFSFFHANF